MNNIEELKKAANAIGYEKWIDSAGEVTSVDYLAGGDVTCDHICNCEALNGESANAKFIALANPATILDLIAQLEAAQKESAIRLEAIEQMRKTVAHNVERAQTAEAALSAAQLDATRWRALLSSPAIRILGHAGLQDDKPIDGHCCHFGMEIWSHYEPYYDNKKAGEVITRYADNMIAASLVEGNADAE